MMIPLVSIPTEVLFVDDHNALLKTLATHLDTTRLTYTFFTDPSLALEHINQPRNNPEGFLGFTELIEPTGYQSVAMKYELADLHRSIFSQNRFDNISVVVADYAMPHTNGLQFLNQIRHKDVKKILLTGAADETIAVNAFNNNLIDRYIKKTAPTYLQDLKNSIEEFSKEYWRTKTQSVKHILSTNYKDLPFDDIGFAKYFDHLIKEYSIAEYYLVEGSFRFLMVDAFGKLYTLCIQSHDEANSYVFEFENYDEADISPSLKEDVRTHRKILCPPIKNGQLPNRSEWINHCKEAKETGAQNQFLVALTEGHNLEQNIVPFDEKKQHHKSFRF